MNHDNRDARFDAAMRQLHEVATERISGRTRLQLQQRPRTASVARPAARRLGWPVAASFAAVLALMVGLQLRQDPAPLPATPAADAVADSGDDIDIVLEENPDLYLWLASNDAYALAME
jgi:ferric-dicitrate binding protein FerR (iron transport regulator)